MSSSRVVLPRLAQFGESGLDNENLAVQKLKANALSGKIVTRGLSRAARKWGGSASRLNIHLQDGGDTPCDGLDDIEFGSSGFQDKSIHLPVIDDNAVNIQSPMRPESRGSKTPTIPGVGYWTKRGGRLRPASVLPDLYLQEDESPSGSKLDLSLTIEGQADPRLLPQKSTFRTGKASPDEQRSQPSPSPPTHLMTTDEEEIFTSLEDNLKQLLLCQSLGLTIERKKLNRGVVATPVFHCPRCFKHWSLFGTPFMNCSQPREPTKGPNIQLSKKSHYIFQKFTRLDPPKRVQIINHIRSSESPGLTLQDDIAVETLLMPEEGNSDEDLHHTSITTLGSSLITRRASIKVKAHTGHGSQAGSTTMLKIKQRRNSREVVKDSQDVSDKRQAEKLPNEESGIKARTQKSPKYEEKKPKETASHIGEPQMYVNDEWNSVKGGGFSRETAKMEKTNKNDSKMMDGAEMKNKPVGKFEFGSPARKRPSVGLVGPDGGYYIGEYDTYGNFAPHTRLNHDGSTCPVLKGSDDLYYPQQEDSVPETNHYDLRQRGLRFDYGHHFQGEQPGEHLHLGNSLELDQHNSGGQSSFQKFSTLLRELLWTHEMETGELLPDDVASDKHLADFKESKRLEDCHDTSSTREYTGDMTQENTMIDSPLTPDDDANLAYGQVQCIQEQRRQDMTGITDKTEVVLKMEEGAPQTADVVHDDIDFEKIMTVSNDTKRNGVSERRQNPPATTDLDMPRISTTSVGSEQSNERLVDSVEYDGVKDTNGQNGLEKDDFQTSNEKISEKQEDLSSMEISPEKRESTDDKECERPKGFERPLQVHDSIGDVLERKASNLEVDELVENKKQSCLEEAQTMKERLKHSLVSYEDDERQEDAERQDVLPDDMDPYYEAFASIKHEREISAKRRGKSGRRGSVDQRGKVKNPAVKNVTGRPDTKAGALKKHMMATPKTLLTQNASLEVGQTKASNKEATGRAAEESDRNLDNDKPAPSNEKTNFNDTGSSEVGMTTEEHEVSKASGGKMDKEPVSDIEEDATTAGKGKRKMRRPAKKEKMQSSVNRRRRVGVGAENVETGERRDESKEEPPTERHKGQDEDRKQENDLPEIIKQPGGRLDKKSSSSLQNRGSLPRITSAKENLTKSSLSKFSKFKLNVSEPRQESNQANFRMTYSTLPGNLTGKRQSSQNLFNRGPKSPDKLPSLVSKDTSPSSTKVLKASEPLENVSEINYVLMKQGNDATEAKPSSTIKSPESRPSSSDSGQSEEPIWESVSEMWQKHTSVMGRLSKLENFSYLPLTQAFTFSFFDIPHHYEDHRNYLKVKGASIKTLKRPPKMKIKGKKKRPPTAELHKLIEEKKKEAGKQNLVQKLWLMEKQAKLNQPIPKLMSF